MLKLCMKNKTIRRVTMDNFRCANCDREFDEEVKVWGGNICCDCSTAFVGGESEEK